ncbi:membrane protein [Marinobacterium nitratireducens]|uniref:Membrane protein n=1 Tax=Marinobacterium nitratireducens TaxID=518897 RepID=A0A917ZF07_9GAMM|nr:tripartite tricarboxylate transporter TctB family protein [Marinobacterium nitratireducens]GGO82008.1 membrane protein [Marinobacterium nitratireducens]
MIGDRILGVLLLLLAVAYGWEAAHFPEPFGGAEAVGPETFPIMLSIILGLSSLYLIVRPDADEPWPHLAMLGELAFVLVILAIFATMLQPVGFIPATTLMVGVLCWRMGARPLPAFLTGIGSAVVVFVLFNFMLELHLPAGLLDLNGG